MKHLLPLAACFIACALISTMAAARADTKVVAYVPNWIDLAQFADTIDYSKLSHLCVAFENPIDDDGTMSFNPSDDILIAKAHANKVKVLVSIGGGSAATDRVLQPRYFALISDAKRRAFVAQLADYVTAHKFDGLDVDIEGPSINGDYGAFIDDLSAALKARKKLLTAALSKGYGGDKVPGAALKRFDWVNVMAYDATGTWDPKSPGQHSSFDLAVSSVKYWLDRGLPKSRLMLGVPFYGYGFGDAFRTRDYPYSELVASFPGAENGDQVGSTIWYNGLPTIRAKAQYVRDQRLGGVMIWSLDYDVSGPRSLLSAIHDVFSAKQTQF